MRIRRWRGAELELVLVEDVVDDGAPPRRDLEAWGDGGREIDGSHGGSASGSCGEGESGAREMGE